MPGIYDSPPGPEHPRPAPPACGHTPGSAGTIVKALKPGGDITNNTPDFILRSLQGGSRELASLRCPQCRSHTIYRHRTHTADPAADIGSDPEVISAALNSLLEQADVNVFTLVVTKEQGLTSYVLPRHRLPAFRVTTGNA